MENSSERNTATFTHLSTLSQYFIPFGNFIFPLLIWSTKKDQSEFVDHNGKQALNFQLSILVYTLILALIAIPLLLYSVLKNIPFNDITNNHSIVLENIDYSNGIGILTVAVLTIFGFACLKIAEFFLIIYAAVKASNGEKYYYPITISFIK
jgi:uncharacterized Tic20 family protein